MTSQDLKDSSGWWFAGGPGLEEVRIHDLRHGFASMRWVLEKAWR